MLSDSRKAQAEQKKKTLFEYFEFKKSVFNDNSAFLDSNFQINFHSPVKHENALAVICDVHAIFCKIRKNILRTFRLYILSFFFQKNLFRKVPYCVSKVK